MSSTKPTPFHTKNPIANRNINSTLPPSAHSQQRLKTLTDHSLLDIEECTFEPKTNHPPHSKRSIRGFLRDQQAFQHSRELKLKRLKEEKKKEEEAEITLSPLIDKTSKRMAERQGSAGSIFQRLGKRPLHLPPAPFTFSPKILNRSQSIKRASDVSSLLYNDAVRRHEKSQFLVQTSRSLTDRATPQINSNSYRLAGKKILSELAANVKDEELSPLVAVLALQDLFHIDLNPNRQGAVLRKLLNFIAHTNQEHVEIVPKDVLFEFVSILVGAEEPCNHFTPKEQQQIFEQFRHFYKERLCKSRRSPTPESLSFHPKTLPASEKLAQCYREKTCQQIQQFLQGQQVNLSLKEGEITIQELFILKDLKKQQENKRKKEEKDQKQLEECTFKPNITPITSLQKAKKDHLKPKITLKPFKKSIPTPLIPSKDKQNINSACLPPKSDKKPYKRGSMTNNEACTKDIEKIVLRMSAGRQKREFSNQLVERGYPKDQNWNKLQKDMHKTSVENLQKIRRLSFKV